MEGVGQVLRRSLLSLNTTKGSYFHLEKDMRDFFFLKKFKTRGEMKQNRILCILVVRTVFTAHLCVGHRAECLIGMLTMALCAIVTRGVSIVIPTSYSYVKGLQLEDFPVFSLLPRLSFPGTCLFYCDLYGGRFCLAEWREDLGGGFSTTYDWGPSVSESGMKDGGAQ